MPSSPDPLPPNPLQHNLGLKLGGTAVVERDGTSLRNWSSFHNITGEDTTHKAGEPLIFPPADFPEGTRVEIYFPED